jgi:hypothetical protein
MKGHYCCFGCAMKDDKEHEVTDVCSNPDCNYTYDFPLKNIPVTIVSDRGVVYTVVKSKERGFYAATYLCESGNLNKKTILKVTPQIFYEKFKKGVTNSDDAFEVFKSECKEHSEIAEGAENHIVGIEDYFKTDIDFSGKVISCFVTELSYIQGLTFNEYIHDPNNIKAHNFAQLAVDLLSIWGILNDKRKYHNDLHGKNLIVEMMSSNVRRIGELNSSIRLVAIDMNSTANENLSGVNRDGDQSYVYSHILEMTGLLRKKMQHINDIDDRDYRLVKTLEKLISLILPVLDRNRTPSIDQLINDLKNDFNSNLSYAPWEKTFELNSLDDGYNAQTIHKCNIPFLLVDPDDNWINDISITGPQIITGMRGCGKTTLLSALDFHSRAVWETKDKEEIILRLKTDQYIGISTSCSNLIDYRGKKATDNNAKLIWLFARELISVVRHMRYINENLLVGDYIQKLILLLQSITTVDLSDNLGTPTDSDFERYLSMKMEVFTEGGTGQLKVSPKKAFEDLASLLMSLSSLWNNKKVFFLLDDASTRYLNTNTISELFTNLLFQSDICSFKITTELQSVELMRLNSPGNVARGREGRDFTMYDFGARVLEKFNSSEIDGGGKKFLKDILRKRAKKFVNHPNKSPEDILGDIPLAEIAKNIASAKKTQDRKTIYHGLSALAGFCVGDIGDVILLYDRIVRKYNNEIPVNPEDQSECYQDLCSNRLYNLNRKGHESNNYQKYAISFADASYFLLRKSMKDYDKKMKEYKKAPSAQKKPKLRLRQYTSMFVKITGDETKQVEQFKKLMELVDAGIFVFQGGSGSPRTKNIGANPIMQFKLVYRKLFGIASLIGLSDRDRFELSGAQLDKWLNNPTKDILIQNLRGETDIDDSVQDDNELKHEKISLNIPTQNELFANIDNSNNSFERNTACKSYPRGIDITSLKIDETRTRHTDVIISALGFEDRSFESIKSILATWKTNKLFLIQYPEDGKSSDILAWLKSSGYDNIIEKVNANQLKPIINSIKNISDCLLDITALSKPLIFQLTNEILVHKKKLFIAYTEAEEYYPQEETINQRFEETKNMSRFEQFKNIMEKLIVGEKTDNYKIISLIEKTECFNERPTILFGFVVAKNQRMLALLEQKEYAWTKLFVSSRDSYRSRLAQMAASVAMSNYSNIGIQKIDQNDPIDIMDHLFEEYNYFYVDQGLNIELALTGTKWQALACAALSSVEKISQCWYAEPSAFDKGHFSYGAKDIVYYCLMCK